jgi:hypothetical protein
MGWPSHRAGAGVGRWAVLLNAVVTSDEFWSVKTVGNNNAQQHLYLQRTLNTIMSRTQEYAINREDM